MSEIVPIYKKLGETPLAALNRLRYERLEFANQKMTYLGRLDPMAEGLLLVLVGDTGEKEKYLALDKVYEFEVLWGFETDTYDLLGVVAPGGNRVACSRSGVGKFATNSISTWLGKRNQAYPPYSSKKVLGKQLWQWAREGEEMEAPQRQIMIYELEHLGDKARLGKDLLTNIEEKISQVRGDFRQTEILAGWRNKLAPDSNTEFLITKFRAHVSSGTYIRSLAHEMGEELGCGALAYSIKRTKVGDWTL